MPEKKRSSQNKRNCKPEDEKFWRLAQTYSRPHIEVLKILYTQDQHALATNEVYRKTSHLDISDRQKRNIFRELDEDNLIDYVKSNPVFLAKKEEIEDTVEKLVEAWNEANSV